MARHAMVEMPKFCRHWISNRLHRCERTRPETSTFIAVGSCTHVTAQRAPHCCVMRQEMEPIQSKCVDTQATWHTGGLFIKEEMLLPCQSCTLLSQYTTIKLWRARGSNMWTGCIKIHALQQLNRLQSPAVDTGSRSAWCWNATHWLAAVSMKQLQSEASWNFRRKKNNIKQESCDAKRKWWHNLPGWHWLKKQSWFSNIAAKTKNIRLYFGRTHSFMVCRIIFNHDVIYFFMAKTMTRPQFTPTSFAEIN